jgi:hypothetical protein
MDIAYLHLVTNHIPIIGLPFALFLLLAGVWLKSDEIKAFGLLAFTVLGILTLGVYLLGQGGEDFVEDLAGVSHDAIEDHQKMATVSLAMVGLTAIVSLFGLTAYKGFRLLLRRAPDKIENKTDAETENTGATQINSRPYFPKWLIFAVLVLALLSSGVLGYTGKLGGKIRHTEFYGGAANTEEKEGDKTDTEKDENEKGRGRNRGRK